MPYWLEMASTRSFSGAVRFMLTAKARHNEPCYAAQNENTISLPYCLQYLLLPLGAAKPSHICPLSFPSSSVSLCLMITLHFLFVSQGPLQIQTPSLHMIPSIFWIHITMLKSMTQAFSQCFPSLTIQTIVWPTMLRPYAPERAQTSAGVVEQHS